MLWPYLLEFLVPEEYTNAISALCQNLCFLAGKQRERDSENFTIDFVQLGRLKSTSNAQWFSQPRQVSHAMQMFNQYIIIYLENDCFYGIYKNGNMFVA